jgi:hypothetical protein
MNVGSFDPVDFIWSLVKTALWGLVAIAIIAMIYTLFSMLFAVIKKKYFKNGK